MSQQDNFVIGVYDDEEKVLHAVEHIRSKGVKITDVFSPFPIHGIDQALGLRRSRLPKAAFWFGFTGFSLALLMQVWMLGIDWPIDIGGKPYVSIPSFIPVTFELTVLIASLGMVGVYLYASRLKPGAEAQLADIRQTDDRFVILVNKTQEKGDGALRQLFNETGALDVRESQLEVPVAY